MRCKPSLEGVETGFSKLIFTVDNYNCFKKCIILFVGEKATLPHAVLQLADDVISLGIFI